MAKIDDPEVNIMATPAFVPQEGRTGRSLRKLRFVFVALMPGLLMAAAQAERPQLVLETGPGLVASMAFSPDGKILASSGADRATALWDVASGRELRTMGTHNDWVSSVAFSPDGSILAEGGNDKTIKLWDLNSVRELRTLTGHLKEVSSVAFSPDGQVLASSGYDATIRLWSVSSGQAIKTLVNSDYPEDRIFSVAFSPDGKILASGSQGLVIKLWDVSSGHLLRTLSGQNGLHVAFSPVGHALAAVNIDEDGHTRVRLWDLSGSPRLTGLIDQGDADCATFSNVAFSPDGRTLVIGGCGLKLWDATDAHELRTLEKSATISAVAFSADGHLAAASRFEENISLWDPSSGSKLRILADHRAQICGLAVDPHGRALAARTLEGIIKLWDVLEGREHLIEIKTDRQNRLCSTAFDPEGRVLAAANDHSATLWDVATGKELRSLQGHTGFVRSVAFGPGGRTLASSGTDHTIKFWDVATGKELESLKNPSGDDSVVFSPDTKMMSSQGYLWNITAHQIIRGINIYPAGLEPGWGLSCPPQAIKFSADGRTLASCDSLWNVSTKKLIVSLRELQRFVTVLSPDGQQAASVVDGIDEVSRQPDTKISLWDTASGRELRAFPGTDDTTALAFSPDGHTLAASDDQGRITLWEVSSGRELATLFLLDKGDWAVVDPAGRFDASPRGMQLMHWAVGLNTIALAQLKERYYEPGLLGKILGLNKEPLRDVAAFDDVKLYPDVRAEAPPPGSTQLKLKLADMGGGIGRVQVFVNGMEFLADARGPKPALSVDASLAVDLAGAHLKPGEPNEIRVVTWNTEGYLSSRGFTVTWDPGGAKDKNPPEFYAIVAGVSEYASPEIRLRFAAKDAEAMAHALKLGASRLFGAEHVHITLLTSPASVGGVGATKASLQQAFDAAAKARPGDVFAVYLAGHGVAIQGLYAYPTADARTLDLSDPAVRLVSAVSDGELVEWINKIPALHKVMILDTCAAGAIEARLVEKRGVPGDQIRAIERLKDRTGFYVLMGSAADAASYEASQFGQGLLTYAVLKGMKGAALRESQFVDLSNLFQEVADDVPQLAKNIGGIQQPRVAMPGGASFDIGQLSAEDRAAIPLATPSPLLLRPLFINTQLHRDNLRLSEALQKRLRNQSYAADRGSPGQPAPVYVDQDDFPGAVSPSGDYTVDGNRVVVTIVLARDGREMSHLTIEGKADDVDSLAASMANEINRAILQ